MTTGTSFDSTKTSLHELLAQAKAGTLQLPDFQRGWVWDDERIAKLIAGCVPYRLFIRSVSLVRLAV